VTQYALDISLPVAYAPEQFMLSESNMLAHRWIDRWPDWNDFALYLQGEQGAGKTHLAHIWQRKTNADFIVADTTELPEKAAIIDGLETWKNEQALFHIYNHCKLSSIPLLITSIQLPDKLHFALPDLLSRLKSLPVAEIHAPDDALLEAVFLKQLSDRQLKISPDVVSYLLPRLPRSFRELSALVTKLDDDSLVAGRTITIPYARQILGF
jgi:chromosomal replication initiation ATPase DnaA